MINIGERLRELRIKSGYTQQQVAKLLNIDRSTYAYYETGKTRPDIDSLVILSRIFNIPINEFLADEKAPQNFSDLNASADYVIGKKNSSHIFNLSPQEKELIGAFRTCTPEEQRALLNYAIQRANQRNGSETPPGPSEHSR